MAKVTDSPARLQNRVQEALHERKASTERIQQLIDDIKKSRVRSTDLVRGDLDKTDTHTRQKVLSLLRQQLRGQIPNTIAKALTTGEIPNEALERLLQRLANANRSMLGTKQNMASSMRDARAAATDKSAPQQAVRWTQFLQKVQQIPGGQIQEQMGRNLARGDATSFFEFLGKRISDSAGASLRAPKLVAKSLQDISPKQRAIILKTLLGETRTEQLKALGIQDIVQFIQAGTMPTGRQSMAKTLRMSRAQLLGYLFRAELLKIGPGQRGELGIRPDFLRPLYYSGIAMMGSLSVIRILSREEMTRIYTLLRRACHLYLKGARDARIVLKRDLLYWSRAAAHNPSEILLSHVDERARNFGRGDAQELIQAWYLENLFWEQLAQAQRRLDARERQEQERLRRESEEREREQREDDEQDRDDEQMDFEFDEHRQDELMCFWITDYGTDPISPSTPRRMYVCIDPNTGAIIPQTIETSYDSSTT